MNKNIIIIGIAFTASIAFTVIFSQMNILLLTLLWGAIAIAECLMLCFTVLNDVKRGKNE